MAKKKVVVLGCGLVGATMARDLAIDPELDVAAADVSAANLQKLSKIGGIRTIQADLGSAEKIAAIVREVDVVVGAMPSMLGLMTLRTVIESGKPFADISFMAEDAMELDALAKKHDVCAVVDCGVAPGLANLAIGHAHANLDQTTRVEFYVGGLPKHPKWPWLYKAPFAPSDVIEEYTRPARMMENGKIVAKQALSECEMIDLPRVGPLEAFNTDGLRSLLRTIPCPNMREKTLRHKGHVELMRVLRDSGFFAKEPMEVRGATVRPLDVTSRLLFPMWKHDPGEEEFTVLRVIVEGTKNGRAARHVFDLYDETDVKTGASSMARTTGFPCAIVARMLAKGELPQRGVLPPELLASHPGMMEHMTRELARRGVQLTHRVE